MLETLITNYRWMIVRLWAAGLWGSSSVLKKQQTQPMGWEAPQSGLSGRPPGSVSQSQTECKARPRTRSRARAPHPFCWAGMLVHEHW